MVDVISQLPSIWEYKRTHHCINKLFKDIQALGPTTSKNHKICNTHYAWNIEKIIRHPLTRAHALKPQKTVRNFEVGMFSQQGVGEVMFLVFCAQKTVYGRWESLPQCCANLTATSFHVSNPGRRMSLLLPMKYLSSFHCCFIMCRGNIEEMGGEQESMWLELWLVLWGTVQGFGELVIQRIHRVWFLEKRMWLGENNLECFGVLLHHNRYCYTNKKVQPSKETNCRPKSTWLVKTVYFRACSICTLKYCRSMINVFRQEL